MGTATKDVTETETEKEKETEKEGGKEITLQRFETKKGESSMALLCQCPSRGLLQHFFYIHERAPVLDAIRPILRSVRGGVWTVA